MDVPDATELRCSGNQSEASIRQQTRERDQSMPYDPIKAAAERNRAVKEARSLGTPEIGIFWFIEGELVPVAIPYTQVQAVEGFRDSPNDHVHFFRTLQRLHPELKYKEYTDHPRGRVIYDEERDRFVCYGSRRFVASAKERQLVTDAFRLPRENTDFISDLHYEDPHSPIFR